MPGVKGKSGRKKKPIETKKLQGTVNSTRDKGSYEIYMVEDLKGIPEPSDVIKEDAVAFEAYEKLSKQLNLTGILMKCDFGMLEAYCISYSLMIDAKKDINQNGKYVYDGDGNIKRSPSINILNDSMAKVKAFGSEFGLSPVKRIQVQATIESGKKQKSFMDKNFGS